MFVNCLVQFDLRPEVKHRHCTLLINKLCLFKVFANTSRCLINIIVTQNPVLCILQRIYIIEWKLWQYTQLHVIRVQNHLGCILPHNILKPYAPPTLVVPQVIAQERFWLTNHCTFLIPLARHKIWPQNNVLCRGYMYWNHRSHWFYQFWASSDYFLCNCCMQLSPWYGSGINSLNSISIWDKLNCTALLCEKRRGPLDREQESWGAQTNK